MQIRCALAYDCLLTLEERNQMLTQRLRQLGIDPDSLL
jgi:hypothetical protein